MTTEPMTPDPRLVEAMTAAVTLASNKNGWGIYANPDGRRGVWIDRAEAALAIIPVFLADPRTHAVFAERLTQLALTGSGSARRAWPERWAAAILGVEPGGA